MIEQHRKVVPRSQLDRDLRALGVAAGQVIMMHASVRSIGWVVGGPDTIIQTILDILGPEGTLAMYITWEEWENAMVLFDHFSEAERRAYLEECPPFDPARSRGNRAWSILTEYLRTWPGAYRSNHPSASFAAVGAKAKWITEDHPLNYGYGWGSPFDKICKSDGKILLLGSPLGTVSMLHYAEHICRVPNKHIVHDTVPMLVNGQREWVRYEEFDTGDPIREWEGGDHFEVLMRDYLQTGKARAELVGSAQSYLLDCPDLVAFGVAWMERIWGRE